MMFRVWNQWELLYIYDYIRVCVCVCLSPNVLCECGEHWNITKNTLWQNVGAYFMVITIYWNVIAIKRIYIYPFVCMVFFFILTYLYFYVQVYKYICIATAWDYIPPFCIYCWGQHPRFATKAKKWLKDVGLYRAAFIYIYIWFWSGYYYYILK